MSKSIKKSGQTDDLAKLKGKPLTEASTKLGKKWKVVQKHELERDYKFKNFKEALAFTNKVGAIAEKLGHHPDIYLAWGEVEITIWTHAVNGLTHYDFELAEAINKLS